MSTLHYPEPPGKSSPRTGEVRPSGAVPLSETGTQHEGWLNAPADNQVAIARDAIAGALGRFRYRPAFRAELEKTARREWPNLTRAAFLAALDAMLAAGNVEARKVDGRTRYQFAGWWDSLNAPKPEPEPCPRCDGTGVIDASRRYGAFVISDTAACPQCTPQSDDEPPF